MEELLFRGIYLSRRSQRRRSVGRGGRVRCDLRRAARGKSGATLFSSVAIALEAGVLLAVAYAATDSLWLPIGIHAGWNYAEGTIFGTAVTGGAFGPEASIIAIPVCLAAAALLALRVKQRRLVEATA